MGIFAELRRWCGGPISTPPPDVGPKYQEALGLYKQDRLDDAEALYRAVLTQAPMHFDALYMLSVIAFRKGQPPAALELIGRAIALDGSRADAHFVRGLVLQNLGRLEDALSSYDQSMQIKPDYAEAVMSGGNLLFELKRPNEALARYERAIEIKPDCAEAFNNRGTVLRVLERPEQALMSYERAIQLKPDYAEAFFNRGNALLDLKRPQEALLSYDSAVKLKPDYVGALYNRGNVLLDLKRPGEALLSYDRVVQLKPDYAEAFNNRGTVLFNLKRPDEALASYDRAVQLKPDYAEAFNNRGNVFMKLMAFNQALESLDRALRLKPDFPEAHYSRGLALRDLKRLNEAHESFGRALQLKPDFAPAGYTRGTIELLRNRYREGAVNNAWGREAEASPTRRQKLFKINAPIWLGENLTGCKPQSALESDQNAHVTGNDCSRSNPDQNLMQIHVVNMRRRKDRREQFLAWNEGKGRPFSFFEAVEGSPELRFDLIAQNLLMDPTNSFTLGSLGNAMSHRALWNQCASTGTNYLILEDDACLRSDFSEMLTPVIGAAGNDWDIIYLGYNTDAMIALMCEDGSISPIAFNDSIKTQSDFFYHYSKHAYANELPLVARCCQIWGTLAYIVSPKGAAKLCRSCFPLNSNNVIEMLGEGRSICASTADGMINLAMQRDVRAFCCLPPLVLGPNDHTDSDVVNRAKS